ARVGWFQRSWAGGFSSSRSRVSRHRGREPVREILGEARSFKTRDSTPLGYGGRKSFSHKLQQFDTPEGCLLVSWAGGAAVGEAATESKDVSARGIYFMLHKEIERGSAVEIVMTLPHDITMVGPVRVSCLGRIQPQPDRRVGVVATLERYEFLR